MKPRFSCARRDRYGMTSFTGPYGTYLYTGNPAWPAHKNTSMSTPSESRPLPPPHAALLSTHPTGSWSDHTSPAAGQSKPYSPWERDSSRSFCAEEHTLEIIDLWIILRVWTHFSSVNLTVSSLWDATMTFAILLWLISSRMYSRHLTDRSGLMKASSTTGTDEQKEVILKYVLFVATSRNIPLSVRANVYCVIVTHVSNVTLMDKISSAQINRCVWSWIQYSSETRERN